MSFKLRRIQPNSKDNLWFAILLFSGLTYTWANHPRKEVYATQYEGHYCSLHIKLYSKKNLICFLVKQKT